MPCRGKEQLRPPAVVLRLTPHEHPAAAPHDGRLPKHRLAIHVPVQPVAVRRRADGVDDHQGHPELGRDAAGDRRTPAALGSEQRERRGWGVPCGARSGQGLQLGQSGVTEHEPVPVERFGELHGVGEPALEVVLTEQEADDAVVDGDRPGGQTGVAVRGRLGET